VGTSPARHDILVADANTNVATDAVGISSLRAITLTRSGTLNLIFVASICFVVWSLIRCRKLDG
jgi:hypothetical protein